jgi:hypothetical protein
MYRIMLLRICEKDSTIRSLWDQGIEVRRSRIGLKITLEAEGPHGLLYKPNILTAPFKKKLNLCERLREKRYNCLTKPPVLPQDSPFCQVIEIPTPGRGRQKGRAFNSMG